MSFDSANVTGALARGASVEEEVPVAARFEAVAPPWRSWSWLLRSAASPAACLAARVRLMAPPLRLLSAPCADGEEAYSIAVALLAAGIADFTVEGVDISAEAIEIARKSVYGADSFRPADGPPEHLERYFRAVEGGFEPVTEVRNRVSFRRADLMSHGALEGRFHAIVCRHLLVHHGAASQGRLIAAMAAALEPRGILFPGWAELTLFLLAGFEEVPDPQAFVCGKPASPPRKTSTARILELLAMEEAAFAREFPKRRLCRFRLRLPRSESARRDSAALRPRMAGDEFAIRKADAHDIGQIVGLLNCHAYGGVTLRRTEAEVSEDIGNFVVAVSPTGRIVGCGALSSLSSFPSTGVIGAVATAPDFRRRGIAGRLVEALIEEASSRSLAEVIGVTGATFLRGSAAQMGWEEVGALGEPVAGFAG